jgi:hypothetical protein
MTKPYTAESLMNALNIHEEAGHIETWSHGYTGSAQARIFFEIVPNGGGPIRRYTAGETHAFLAGIMSCSKICDGQFGFADAVKALDNSGSGAFRSAASFLRQREREWYPLGRGGPR